MNKRAFALAEVLITLGIIGVIAAITLPTVISNYKKKLTAVKLQRFYSLMNQAIQRWETDEGLEPNQVKFSVTFDDNGKRNAVNDFQNWYDNSLDKYITSLDKNVDDSGMVRRYTIKLNDGSGFNGYISNSDMLHIFYCTEAMYCKPESYDGKRTFLFTIYKGILYTGSYQQFADRNTLLETCQNAANGKCNYCARLIQTDGWKIKDDYPIQF